MKIYILNVYLIDMQYNKKKKATYKAKFSFFSDNYTITRVTFDDLDKLLNYSLRIYYNINILEENYHFIND
jgi:hypothetical protein